MFFTRKKFTKKNYKILKKIIFFIIENIAKKFIRFKKKILY